MRLGGAFFDETSIALGYDVHLDDSADDIADFSQADLEAQALLIHEMTHVWLRAQTGSLFDYLIRGLTERTYDYKLTGQDRFSSFGMEQQADIVEDYFRLRNGLKPQAGRNPDRTPYDNLLRPMGIQ